MREDPLQVTYLGGPTALPELGGLRLTASKSTAGNGFG
jgi:hypothetical protein